MPKYQCPGQDMRYWKPEDIFEVPCPVCDYAVEFFKDDISRKCPKCGYEFKNPRLDMGCAEWCPYADRCLAELGRLPGGKMPELSYSPMSDPLSAPSQGADKPGKPED